MRKILIFFFFILFLISCSKDKKAKDIVVEEISTPCDCVSTYYLVISELNTLKARVESGAISDSHEYLNEKNILESIANSIDEKCIVYEGADSVLQSCVDFQNLVLEMDVYGF